MPPWNASQLPHLFINRQPAAKQFSNPSGGGNFKLPVRDRLTHGQDLQAQLDRVAAVAQPLIDRQKILSAELDTFIEYGTYVSFLSAPNFNLKTDSLEDARGKIELITTKPLALEEVRELTQATVFVPEGKLAHFKKKFDQYLTQETPKGKAKNKDLVESISTLRLAAFNDLWTDEGLFPSAHETIWWEIWLRAGENEDEQRQILDVFRKQAANNALPVSTEEIFFPENTVLLLQASAWQIETAVFPLNILAELRKAKETAHFFLNLGRHDERDWVADTVSRIIPPPADAPAVCLLDTGVNHAHPLLKVALSPSNMDAYNAAWGNYDHQGHGTEMAGLGLYGDLLDTLISTGPIPLEHKLESVKILPPDDQNEPELYGEITKECVARAEVFAPHRKRAICLTVTTTDSRDRGQPSSWSADIDALCSGAEEEDSFRRFVVISAGNVAADAVDNYPDSNYTDGVHDPGQAWNAITVGAYTEKVLIDQASPVADGMAVAPGGGLSPTSVTSLNWSKEWPFKPDIVLEGGNLARHKSFPTPFIEESLRLLTTHKSWDLGRFLTSTGDTSAATAQAARMGAIIMAQYPDLWPETVRALLVHSARWTSQMQSEFSDNLTNLLRCYGYGVPNLAESLYSAKNSLTLIAQNSLQPFYQDGSVIKTNELHIHQLPWPREQLLDLGETEVELRVTLSYFIEPNPSRRNNFKKHTYASHGLRFETKTATESLDDFNKRINKLSREEGENYGAGDSAEWLFGSKRRVRGSLHSDIWRGTAANLATKDSIAVYPVGGWWKDLRKKRKWDSQMRYSLVVTIKAPDIDVDIYTPVANVILV